MRNFWQDKRVLITGHTGFKGSWLSLWLHLSGAKVCGFSLAPPQAAPNLFENLRLASRIDSVTGDVRELPALEKTFRDFQPEIVFHLAAQSLVRRSYREPAETYATNVIGTVNVLEAVRKSDSVRSVLVVTTDKCYENREWMWGYRETDRLGGFDPYSNSKACAELATAAYRNSFFAGEGKTLVATARAGNVIGGGDWSEDRLLPDVFRSLVFDEPLVIRSPNAVRPWQHALDPLAGYMLLAEKLFAGDAAFAEMWNFGPDEYDAKSVGWILERIRNLWKGKVNWEIHNGDHPHETNLLKLDSTKARNKLQWQPKLNLDEALNLTVEWYKAFKNNEDLTEITEKQIEAYAGMHPATGDKAVSAEENFFS